MDKKMVQLNTTYEDIQRLKEGSDYEMANQGLYTPYHKNLYYNRNSLEPVLKDLEELKLYKQVNSLESVEDLNKWLQTFHNISGQELCTSQYELSNKIERYLFAKTYEALEDIPKAYGLRNKVAELVPLKDKPKPSPQYQFDL